MTEETANPHLGTRLRRGGPTPSHASPCVILLHGRNQAPETMLEVAARIGLERVAHVVPEAEGWSWYPAGFMAPPAENALRLTYALERLQVLEDELGAAGVSEEQLVWVGFSQGACLLCEHVYRRAVVRPPRWAGLAVLTGGLGGPAGTRWATPPALAEVPIHLGTSSLDTWVPVDRVRETAKVFEAMGARVTLDVRDDPEHRVHDDDIHGARALIPGLLA